MSTAIDSCIQSASACRGRAVWPAARWLGSTCLASGLRIDDSQCGYTVISKSAAHFLLGQGLWPSYGYPNDVLVRLGRAGFAVVERTVRPVHADEVSGRPLLARARGPLGHPSCTADSGHAS